MGGREGGGNGTSRLNSDFEIVVDVVVAVDFEIVDVAVVVVVDVVVVFFKTVFIQTEMDCLMCCQIMHNWH